jgi:hypothetical protein
VAARPHHDQLRAFLAGEPQQLTVGAPRLHEIAHREPLADALGYGRAQAFPGVLRHRLAERLDLDHRELRGRARLELGHLLERVDERQLRAERLGQRERARDHLGRRGAQVDAAKNPAERQARVGRLSDPVPHGQHRAGRVAQQLFRHGSEQHVLETRVRVETGYQQVGRELLGEPHQLARRRPLEQPRVRGHAARASRLGERLEPCDERVALLAVERRG